jgi:Lsr2
MAGGITPEGKIMAKKVQVLLVDDVDKSSPADETVSFSLDGVSYEIDLTSKNAAKLRDDLSVWIGHAERTGGRRSSGRSAGKGTGRKADLGAVREWARQNGHKVSDRGRISADVQAAYDKAHG